MMRRVHQVIILVLLCFPGVSHSQDILFLHHSIGTGFLRVGDINNRINQYNTANQTHYTLTDRYFPGDPYPKANNPYDYWNLWANKACDDRDPDMACLGSLCESFDVIMFKHCYPSAEIEADEATSSAASQKKTVGNYKMQYRALRAVLDKFPNNRFIIWTLAPSHRLGTNTGSAARAREFVNWVKTDWLTEDGKKHPNIYVFDFFGFVAESDPEPEKGQFNCLKYRYEVTHTENNAHPNNWAYVETAPHFAAFLFNILE